MKNALRTLLLIDKKIFKVQRIVILLAAAVMLIVNGAQVFCRYVLHASLPWSEQTSLLLFLILIMLGANIGVKTDSETRIDIINPKNPKKKALLYFITNVFGILAVVIFIISSTALIKFTDKFPQIYSSLHISYNVGYVCMLVGFILILYAKIINTLKNLCIMRGIDISDLYPDELSDTELEAREAIEAAANECNLRKEEEAK